MPPQLKPVPRQSLSDSIVEQMTALIARGELRPGDRIPSEKYLCQQFGVGRTSVREALRSLSAMGMVESHAGDGTFVSASRSRRIEQSLRWGILPDAGMIKDLVEARVMLESHIASLAASRATDADIERMVAAIHGMKAAEGDHEAYLRHDLEFHLAIAQGARNPILCTMLETTRGYLQTWIRQTLASSPRRAALSITEHKRIVKAIEARDADQARQAMIRHLLSSGTDLRKQIAAKTTA